MLKKDSFVICNKGYTIERFIHGMSAEYNDIQEWKYKDLLPVVRTKQETHDLFQNKEFSSAPFIQVRSPPSRSIETISDYGVACRALHG
jgi:pyruvate decarboxylase